MKTRLVSTLVLITAVLTPVTAQQAPQKKSESITSAKTINAPPSEARAVSSDSTPVMKVSVTADSWNGEFVTYKSGDNYVVIVPQAKTSAIKWNITGRGLAGVQVEQRGDDVFVLLRVESAPKPSVQQEGNRLDIFFSNAAQPVTSSEGSATVSNGAALLNGSTPSVESTSAPVSSPIPTGSPGTGAASPILPQGIGQTLMNLLKKNTTADSLNLDLSVPESPAFTVLGLNPQNVVRPATPQEFASTLINGLDQNGNFQNGLAIDTAPFMLFNGENVKIRDYMDQYLTRLLARTQFSFAVAKGANEEDLSTRLSVGLNLTLWDRGDPRVYRPGEEGDVLDCFVRNLDTSLVIPPSVDPDNEVEVRNFVASELTRLKPLADTCRAEGQKARWNRSAWTLAYAPSWISKTGTSSGFKWNGGALWTSFAYGFEEVPSLKKLGQLILHARYRTREQVPDQNNAGTFLTQDTFLFGGRFRAGSPKFGFNIEDSFLRTKTLNGRIDSSNRFSVGAELRVTDNLYFVISTGGNSGRSDGKSNGFVMTTFKYGFNKQSQLNPQPQP